MKNRQKLRWAKLLRRGIALFLATFALWLLSITCDLGAACVRLGESSAFVSAALQAGLGVNLQQENEWSGLNRWQKLVLSQSSLLSYSATVPDVQPSPPAVAPSASLQDDPPAPQVSVPTQDVPSQTILPSGSDGSLNAAGVNIFNYTSLPVDVQTVASAQVGVTLVDDGPQILIIHTHASEAYTMDGTDVYQESDAYRTTDDNYNVVRVGDEMQQVFESMGLQVVHDRTLYDYPQYDGSYTRSRASVQQWLDKYPSIQVILDVHRDALVGEDGTIFKPIANIDGEKTAQVLMIVGTNDLGQDHPNWTQNLALAVRIQQQLDSAAPTLARPITLRSSSFNQQLSCGFLLVEVGSHGNTLQEALRAGRLFARAAGEILLDLK